MSQKDTTSPRFPTLANEIENKIIGDVIPLYQPFLQLIKLSEILGRILHSLYTPKAKKFSSECDNIVKHLGDSLTTWYESLPPLLQNCTRKKGVVHNSPSVSLSGTIFFKVLNIQ